MPSVESIQSIIITERGKTDIQPILTANIASSQTTIAALKPAMITLRYSRIPAYLHKMRYSPKK